MERRFIQLLIEHLLPLDGYRFHNSRHSWKQSRVREREARKRGDEWRRYDWDDVFTDPAPMLADLRTLLSRPAARAGTRAA